MSQQQDSSVERSLNPEDVLEPIPGTSDNFGSELQERRRLEKTFREVLKSYGAREIETPNLERKLTFDLTDLDDEEMLEFPVFDADKDKDFQEKLQESENPVEELEEVEAKHDLSLRYEGTDPVGRFVAKKTHEQGSFNPKLFYITKMFRNEDISDIREDDTQREFTQAAVENFGVSSYAADAEAIDMSVRALQGLGLDANARISDIRLFDGLVEEVAKYTDQTKGKTRTEMQSIVDGISGARVKPEDSLEEAISDLDDFAHEYGLNSELEETLYQLAGATGEPGEYPSNLEAVNINEKTDEGVEAVTKISSLLDELGTSHSIDTSAVRGLDLYSGPVFQTDVQMSDGSTKGEVAGGGRYDSVVGTYLEAAGLDPQEEVPATGFAWGVDRVLEALMESDSGEQSVTEADTVVYADNSGKALARATELREKGYNVETIYEGNLDQAREYAENRGMDFEIV